jgi:hypothetical protein
MKFKQRPGIKELSNKLSQAKLALAEGKCFFGPNLDKLVDEFVELRVNDAQEIWSLLQELFKEISPEHYAGPHPPMKSTESNLNCELFVFVWDSKKLERSMYLKFAIKDGFFYYVSFSSFKKPEKCWKFVDNFHSFRFRPK